MAAFGINKLLSGGGKVERRSAPQRTPRVSPPASASGRASSPNSAARRRQSSATRPSCAATRCPCPAQQAPSPQTECFFTLPDGWEPTDGYSQWRRCGLTPALCRCQRRAARLPLVQRSLQLRGAGGPLELLTLAILKHTLTSHLLQPPRTQPRTAFASLQGERAQGTPFCSRPTPGAAWSACRRSIVCWASASCCCAASRSPASAVARRRRSAASGADRKTEQKQPLRACVACRMRIHASLNMFGDIDFHILGMIG